MLFRDRPVSGFDIAQTGNVLGGVCGLRCILTCEMPCIMLYG